LWKFSKFSIHFYFAVIMEKSDIDTINGSLPAIIRSIDLTQQFLSLLKSFRVFSDEMIGDILKNEDPKFKLCTMLICRGPSAYKNFIEALIETNQTTVVQHLNETRAKLGLPPSTPPVVNNIECNTGITGVSYRVTLPQSSAKASTPSLNEEYRRRVLDPPNYMEQTPALVQPSTITDAAPDYTTLNIKVKIGTEIRGIAQNAYPNRNRKPRGQALIINYDRFTNASPRIGSEKDVIHLDQLLQQLGYTVTLKTNLNLAETFNEIDLYTKYEEHKNADSTIVALMSHGKGGNTHEGTLIYTSDGRLIPSEDILSRFNNRSCPLLQGKPKIFLFQFCRGDGIDQGLRQPLFLKCMSNPVTDGSNLPDPSAEFQRSYDDMLIAYSSLPGYVSYREESEGTWFIKALCLIFMEEAHCYHVDRLLERVDELIKCWTAKSNGKQTLEIIKRGFNRKFFFNPGLWAE